MGAGRSRRYTSFVPLRRALVPLAAIVAALALPAAAGARSSKAVCAPNGNGFAHCHARVVTDSAGKPAATSGPAGYAPADLVGAYGLASLAASAGSGRTVAIVDAYGDPNAASDLAVYRSRFGLPACTVASGCFRQVDQNGGSNLPRGNTGWAEEISLDLDMVSAICPNCRILLVEASSASMTALGSAVNTAARLGASAISNSYGGNEFSSELSTESAYYRHPGIAITVSSGDSGYGAEFPAASQYVTAVGGTSLQRAANARGFSEAAWSGAGSGCSAYEPKPGWQHDSGCARRSIADVSAVADPNTGVSVYDTYHDGGWLVFGGTSVASPIVAGVYALAGGTPNYGADPYAAPGSLFDVSSGSNGTCGGGYLCTAVTGYDGPTGLGTPNGAGAF
jgi:subtilase family serine protease